MVWFCVVALAVTGVALFVTSCGMLRMSFVDFPVNKLKTWDPVAHLNAQPPDTSTSTSILPSAVRQIAGDGVCTLRSSTTTAAGRFLPGTTFVDVLVNGKACALVVDTGCQTTSLSPRLAKRAEVPINKTPAWTWEKSDGQGATPIYRGLATNLVLGTFTISNVPVNVMGKQHEVRLLGIPVYHMDGMLGMDVLQNFAITFVLSDGSIRISRTVPSPLPHAKRIPFRLSKNINMMIAKATLNGEPIGDCLVDTGSSGCFVLTEAMWNKLGLGKTKAQVNVQMGDVYMDKVPAEMGNIAGMAMVPMNVLATKGTKTITIDFPANQIIYE